MSLILFSIEGLEGTGGMQEPCNFGTLDGQEYDDCSCDLYGAQVHLKRPLSDSEFWALRDIESMFDMDGDFPDEGEDWDDEEHRCWLNFDFFSDAARAYLNALS